MLILNGYFISYQYIKNQTMHELSIVMNIVDIANDYLKKANAKKILEIELEIGTLSGVDFAALDFALEVGVQDSIISNSKKIINKIQAKAQCLECQHKFEIDSYYYHCPECNGFRFDILQGKELRVKSITVD